MESGVWILVGTAILLVITVSAALIQRKRKHWPTDYYAIFIMGVVWLPVGIAVHNYGLAAMGLLFMAVGLSRREKWKENRRTWNSLSKEEKIFRICFILVVCLLLVVGIAAYLSFS